jgi:uncharacterized membrane protein YedE/YeeE
MSGIELAGLALGLGPYLASSFDQLSRDREDFGFLPGILLRGLPEARDVVEQVREHIIKGDGGQIQAMAFKDSYTPTFNMVGVAGAIIAQIALTALGLPNLDDTHWTARAAFVTALVAGSLAVFCSCVLQGKMSGLHNAYAVRRWLTRPHETMTMLRHSLDHFVQTGKAVTEGIELNAREGMPAKDKNATSEDIIAIQQKLSTLRQELKELTHRPSLSAALIITAPSQLLNVALASLLAGFGIYYGMVYTSRLPAIADHHSALAVLIVYVVSVASGFTLFYLPMLFKDFATMRDGQRSHLQTVVTDLESTLDAILTMRLDAVTPKPDDSLSALNKIIRIQSEQLQLQKDLIAGLENRFGATAGSVVT